MAKQMGIRPSSLYNIEGELEQWCFDRAVQTFGNALESKLQLIAKASKNQKSADRKVNQEADKWLSSADAPGKTTGRFADPASALKRKA